MIGLSCEVPKQFFGPIHFHARDFGAFAYAAQQGLDVRSEPYVGIRLSITQRVPSPSEMSTAITRSNQI